jgi:hypothetical protein
LYGIGGLGLTFWGFDSKSTGLDEWYGGKLDVNTTEFGINLGGGLNVVTNENLAIAPEMMYTFGGVKYLRIGVKIMFAL